MNLCESFWESEIFLNKQYSFEFGDANLDCAEDKRKSCHTSQWTILILDRLPLERLVLVLAKASVLHILSRCERRLAESQLAMWHAEEKH